MKKKINIFWFREDLRLVDNAGFYHAASDCSVLPIYILDLVNNKEQNCLFNKVKRNIIGLSLPS